jgi:hypothetical protein
MIRLVAVAAAVASAILAGFVVLSLRRRRNHVLFRHGQPAYRDVAMSRELLIVIAVVGTALGLLGRRLGTMIVLACSPALLFVALTAVIVFQQSRSRLP